MTDDIFVNDENLAGLMQMNKTLGNIVSQALEDYESGQESDEKIEMGMLVGLLSISTALCLLVRSQEFHYRDSAERFNVN